ncbi:MAG: HpsJ family protein [Leptolyngbyaceae bacterium]|nr:HpsJ family protein [Leptolyngbyaceae bacterium]
MNALNSRQLSPLVSLAFKTIGIIMIIGPLLDMILLPLPYQFQTRAWVVESISVAVDRGFVPMIGISLILAGAWIDSLASTEPKARPLWRSLSFWGLILATVFAAIYLLLTIFNTVNVLALQNERINSITEEAAQAEQQLESRIDAEIGQRRQQIEQLLQDDRLQQILQNEQLKEQAIAQGVISAEDAERLQAFQEDPEQLNVFFQGLEDQAATLRTERQTEIGVQREEAQQNARTAAFKDLSRVSVSSIILALGYGLIGWTGLRLFLRGTL